MACMIPMLGVATRRSARSVHCPYSTFSMVSVSAEIDLIVLRIEPKPHLF